MAGTKKTQEQYYLGVDLGGTKILAAVIAADGKIISRAKKKTKARRPQEEILNRVALSCREAAQEAGLELNQIKAVGVGSPGPLDPVKGCIIETPNLNLTGAPVVPFLQNDLGLPAFLDNDVNVGTVGEFVYGAAKGYKDAIGIFVGTGIGGGVIINGQLLHGLSLNAGELGHMKIVVDGDRCGCGQRGCLEAYASKTALIRNLKKAFRDKKPTLLRELIKNDWSLLTSKVFQMAVAKKDKLVVTELKKSAKYIGVAVGSLLNTLSPEIVVIGGGMVEALPDLYLPIIEKFAKQNSFPIMWQDVKIVPAALGDDAGILGAAAIAMTRLGKK